MLRALSLSLEKTTRLHYLSAEIEFAQQAWWYVAIIFLYLLVTLCLSHVPGSNDRTTFGRAEEA